MKSLVRALWVEMLKLKRTLALWLTIVAPAVIAGLQFALVLERGYSTGDTQWSWFVQQTLMLWALLMLPLFVTLETALLGGLEHANHQWKHLFALPLARWTVYVAKLIVGAGLIGFSMVVLVGLTVLSGLALRVLKPGLGFEAPIPLAQFLHVTGLVYLAAWLIISIHTWVGLRWRSFVVAMGVGIAVTVVAVMVVESDWAGYYPWTLPGLIAITMRKGQLLTQEALACGIGGVIVGILGCWEVTRRDVL